MLQKITQNFLGKNKYYILSRLEYTSVNTFKSKTESGVMNGRNWVSCFNAPKLNKNRPKIIIFQNLKKKIKFKILSQNGFYMKKQL